MTPEKVFCQAPVSDPTPDTRSHATFPKSRCNLQPLISNHTRVLLNLDDAERPGRHPDRGSPRQAGADGQGQAASAADAHAIGSARGRRRAGGAPRAAGRALGRLHHVHPLGAQLQPHHHAHRHRDPAPCARERRPPHAPPPPAPAASRLGRQRSHAGVRRAAAPAGGGATSRPRQHLHAARGRLRRRPAPRRPRPRTWILRGDLTLFFPSKCCDYLLILWR